MRSLVLISIFILSALQMDAQSLVFTQYNVSNVQSLSFNRSDNTVNDEGSFRVHDLVDNTLNVTRPDIENWITTNFTNVNTNAFVLVSNHRIVTSGETTATIDGNMETITIDFNIVDTSNSFYFNLKGKVLGLNNLSSVAMTDLENALNSVYASFVNTVQ